MCRLFGACRGDRCVNEAVDAYLLDGVIPAADVECPAAGARKR
ncbi:alpha/beta hydrolase [Nonomuraea sp. CA-141351]